MFNWLKGKDQTPETREEYRQDIEDSKEKWILRREKLYTFIAGFLVIILALLAWTLWSWRNANNVAGSTSAHLNDVLAKIEEKLDTVDTANLSKDLHENLVEIRGRVADLKNQQDALTNLTNNLSNETVLVSRSFQARMQTLDSVLVASRGAVNETERQIKSNGDALSGTVLSVKKLVDDNTPQINEAVTALNRGMKGLSSVIETSDPKIVEILANLNTVTISTNGLIQSFTPIGNNLAGATDDFHKMTSDTQLYLHNFFFPPPAKTVGGKILRVFKYVLTPLMDGTKLYFLLRQI